MQIPKYLDTDRELSGALDPGGVGKDLYAMFDACFTNDTEAIQRFLQKDPALGEYAYVTNPIGFAVYGGSEDAVRLLLEHGVRPKSDLRFGDNLLSLSKARGDSTIYRLILSALQEKYHYNEDQEPVQKLFQAVKENDLQNLNSNFAQSSDINGKNALHIAADTKASKEVLDKLVSAGVTLQKDTQGLTPLDIAFSKTNIEFVRYFSALYKDDLASLAFIGDKTRFRHVFQSNNIPLPDNHAFCPLAAASRMGHEDIVQIILANFPDAWQNERQNRLDIALQKAVDDRNISIVSLLLEHSADPNARPLTNNGRGDKPQELVNLLISYGGCVSAWDYCGQNKIEALAQLLHHAPELARSEKSILLGRSPGDNLFTSVPNSPDMLRLLLKHGADPTPTSNWCNSYTWKHTEIAEQLLDQGADPNMKTMTSASPLHLLVSFRPNLDVIKILANRGADIDAVEELSGTTPLGYAAARGHIESMTALIENGANPNPPVETWASPLAIAERHGKTEAVTYLKQAS